MEIHFQENNWILGEVIGLTKLALKKVLGRAFTTLSSLQTLIVYSITGPSPLFPQMLMTINWCLAVVEDTISGENGPVRAVKIRTSTGKTNSNNEALPTAADPLVR